MKTLRITGVPEHFNLPFVLLAEQQFLKTQGIQIEWIEESRGSGQMNLALRTDQTDIAILLTESFLQDFEAGNPSKMIGFHVETPLTWGIHLRANSDIRELDELKKKHFFISRMGSGSHLMARVLAKRQGWNPEDLSFEVIQNMDGAKVAMDAGKDGLFLWEKYTTAPMVLNGTMQRIGEIPSPWPCFVIVVSERALSEFGASIFLLRDELYRISNSLKELPDLAAILADRYKLDQKEVEKWLTQTRWKTTNEVSVSEMKEILSQMSAFGLLKEIPKMEDFLTLDQLSLVD